jgi:hypothetical protein
VPKLGDRKSFSVSVRWANGAKGTQSFYTSDEAARFVRQIKERSVQTRRPVDVRYRHKVSGTDLTVRFDWLTKVK